MENSQNMINIKKGVKLTDKNDIESFTDLCGNLNLTCEITGYFSDSNLKEYIHDNLNGVFIKTDRNKLRIRVLNKESDVRKIYKFYDINSIESVEIISDVNFVIMSNQSF